MRNILKLKENVMKRTIASLLLTIAATAADAGDAATSVHRVNPNSTAEFPLVCSVDGERGRWHVYADTLDEAFGRVYFAVRTRFQPSGIELFNKIRCKLDF